LQNTKRLFNVWGGKQGNNRRAFCANRGCRERTWMGLACAPAQGGRDEEMGLCVAS